jgi:demethylmenaquinone methyltransferase/2-methoxy-6-polyprenyl-1,4-benzoquinol methylase
MFDAIAARYDLLNHVLSAGIDRRWRRRAVRALALSPADRVLDLCTGTADLAIEALTGNSRAGHVIGVDFSEAMLRVGREKVRARQLAPVLMLVRGDATRIPLADCSVQAVTIAFGIRNVERPDVVCGEIRRVLAPGGRLAVLEFAVPTVPGLRSLYLWYLNRVLPRIGRIVSRHDGAYGYLPASVSAFASPSEFSHTIRQAGFTSVTATPLTAGIVYLYTAHRPGAILP